MEPERIINKKLSKTDVEKRLAVPMRALPEFQLQPGEYRREFEAVGIHDGRVWNFELAIRREDPKGNPRPELRGSGWKSYVETKGLIEGDLINFKREGEQFRVEAILDRDFRLFGGNHLLYK